MDTWSHSDTYTKASPSPRRCASTFQRMTSCPQLRDPRPARVSPRLQHRGWPRAGRAGRTALLLPAALLTVGPAPVLVCVPESREQGWRAFGLVCALGSSLLAAAATDPTHALPTQPLTSAQERRWKQTLPLLVLGPADASRGAPGSPAELWTNGHSRPSRLTDGRAEKGGIGQLS